ncbi:MAG TPA: deoxyribose-phosphate aldolase, partial [Aliidiomarina sp.]|nr:deoxyribose-phosphate aldolase [Aliidiomarina sp.]
MTEQQIKAKQAFSLLDLTSLTDAETPADIEALAENARLILDNGDVIHVAALCVFPRFIPLARRYLDQRNLFAVHIATVANFPNGGDDIDMAVTETRACIAYGADEVDVVFPYQAFMEGNEQLARLLITACKRECGHKALLKVILETG